MNLLDSSKNTGNLSFASLNEGLVVEQKMGDPNLVVAWKRSMLGLLVSVFPFLLLPASATSERVSSASTVSVYAFSFEGSTWELPTLDDYEIVSQLLQPLSLPTDERAVTANSVVKGICWGNTHGEFALEVYQAWMADQLQAFYDSRLNPSSATLAGHVQEFSWFGQACSEVNVHAPDTVDAAYLAGLSYAEDYFSLPIYSSAAFQKLCKVSHTIQPVRIQLDDSRELVQFHYESSKLERELTLRLLYDRHLSSVLPIQWCVIDKSYRRHRTIIRSVNLRSQTSQYKLPRVPSDIGETYSQIGYNRVPVIDRSDGKKLAQPLSQVDQASTGVGITILICAILGGGLVVATQFDRYLNVSSKDKENKDESAKS